MVRRVKSKVKFDEKELTQRIVDDPGTQLLKICIFNMSGHLRNVMKIKSQCGDYSNLDDLVINKIKIRRINNDFFDEDYFRDDWIYLCNRIIKASVRIMKLSDVQLLKSAGLLAAFREQKYIRMQQLSKKWASYVTSPYADVMENTVFLMKFFAVADMVTEIMDDEKSGRVTLSIDKKEKMYIRTFCTRIEKMFKKYEKELCDMKFDPNSYLRTMESLEKSGYRIDRKAKIRCQQMISNMKSYKRRMEEYYGTVEAETGNG